MFMKMNREEIIKQLKRYFEIHELVGISTYNKYGERAWMFLDTDALHALLIVRQGMGYPITVNNWFWGGKFSQRGLRTNLQQIFRKYFGKSILYLSGHVLGKAFDFDVEGFTAEEVRSWVIRNEDLFPFKIRLENTLNGKQINWVHLDTLYEIKNPKVYLLNI